MAMLTVKEVAARYKVSPRAVRRWITSGKLRAMRIGQPWIISEEALVEATQYSPRQQEEARRGE